MPGDVRVRRREELKVVRRGARCLAVCGLIVGHDFQEEEEVVVEVWPPPGLLGTGGFFARRRDESFSRHNYRLKERGKSSKVEIETRHIRLGGLWRQVVCSVVRALLLLLMMCPEFKSFCIILQTDVRSPRHIN